MENVSIAALISPGAVERNARQQACGRPADPSSARLAPGRTRSIVRRVEDDGGFAARLPPASFSDLPRLRIDLTIGLLSHQLTLLILRDSQRRILCAEHQMIEAPGTIQGHSARGAVSDPRPLARRGA